MGLKGLFVALGLGCIVALLANVWFFLEPSWREAPRSAGAVLPPIPAALLPAPMLATPAGLERKPIAQSPPDTDFHALSPQSEAFAERVDDVIPARLYRVAAECYDGGSAGRNEKVKFSFRAQISAGELSVSNVSMVDSNISDTALTDCMQNALLNARWAEPDMPDWEDEDELLIRLRGLRKHVEKLDEES